MTIPALPPQGDTSWYDWATGMDTEARKVTNKLDTSAAAELIRDTIGAALVAGTNITITVNDAGDSITIASSGGYTDEQVRDVIAAALVAGSGMTITVNDGSDTITLASSGGGGGSSAAVDVSYGGSTNLSAANVEAALDELDTKKAAKPKSARAMLTSAQSISATTFTKIAFSNEIYDEIGEYDPATQRLTSVAGGDYLVTVGLEAILAAGQRVIISWFKNGTEAYPRFWDFTQGGANTACFGTTLLVRLAAGDYMEIFGWSSVAETYSATSTTLMITKVA